MVRLRDYLYCPSVQLQLVSVCTQGTETTIRHFGPSLSLSVGNSARLHHAIYLLLLSSSQLEKMLGAAGRAAGGLVKQAVKAGNVSQILPTASVARKYPFIVHFINCQM